MPISDVLKVCVVIGGAAIKVGRKNVLDFPYQHLFYIKTGNNFRVGVFIGIKRNLGKRGISICEILISVVALI